MTTTIFDTAAHPRILDGTFTAKQQTAPDAIDLTRPVSHGLIDEVPTVFDATDFGAPARHIDKIELTYQPDLDVVHVRAGRSLDVAAMRPKGMSELGWLTRLDEKQAAVKTYFAEQFGADIDVTETWNDAVAWGELEPVADIATPAEVRVLAGRHAGLTKLDANISWRTIEDDLDAYLRVHQVADEDSITDSLTVEEAQVRQQVRARKGRGELEDRVAIAGARLISDKLSIYRPGTSAGPVFDKLAKTGAVNVEEFGPAIGSIYTDLMDDDRELVSALGTWAIAKHREELARG